MGGIEGVPDADFEEGHAHKGAERLEQRRIVPREALASRSLVATEVLVAPCGGLFDGRVAKADLVQPGLVGECCRTANPPAGSVTATTVPRRRRLDRCHTERITRGERAGRVARAAVPLPPPSLREPPLRLLTAHSMNSFSSALPPPAAARLGELPLDESVEARHTRSALLQLAPPRGEQQRSYSRDSPRFSEICRGS